MNEELQLLVRNARIQLGVEVEDLHHFRPRKGEGGSESAVIQLSPVERGPYFAKILDEREDSVLISRGLSNIRTIEKKAKGLDILNQKRLEAAKTEARENWPEFLGLNASVYLDYEEARSGRRHPVLVLRNPEESEEEGLLTAISFKKDSSSSFAIRESRGSWFRMVLSRDKEKENTSHFLLVTVTSKDTPIVVFHRSIDGDALVATDYILADCRRIIQRKATITETEWLEGEPLPEAIASFEEEALEEPAEEKSIEVAETCRAAGKNGKVAAVCNNDDCGATTRINPKNIGQSRCKKCNKGILVEV